MPFKPPAMILADLSRSEKLRLTFLMVADDSSRALRTYSALALNYCSRKSQALLLLKGRKS